MDPQEVQMFSLYSLYTGKNILKNTEHTTDREKKHKREREEALYRRASQGQQREQTHQTK